MSNVHSITGGEDDRDFTDEERFLGILIDDINELREQDKRSELQLSAIHKKVSDRFGRLMQS